MYSEAIIKQVSISQCIVLSSPGLSPINLRLHVPVELPLPFLVYRQISILTLDFLCLVLGYENKLLGLTALQNKELI